MWTLLKAQTEKFEVTSREENFCYVDQSNHVKEHEPSNLNGVDVGDILDPLEWTDIELSYAHVVVCFMRYA